MKTFYYHYNKPLSQKSGIPIISIHYSGKCIFVEGIKINVSTYSYNRKAQPRLVIKGRCREIKIEENVAFIN